MMDQTERREGFFRKQVEDQDDLRVHAEESRYLRGQTGEEGEDYVPPVEVCDLALALEDGLRSMIGSLPLEEWKMVTDHLSEMLCRRISWDEFVAHTIYMGDPQPQGFDIFPVERCEPEGDQERRRQGLARFGGSRAAVAIAVALEDILIGWLHDMDVWQEQRALAVYLVEMCIDIQNQARQERAREQMQPILLPRPPLLI